MMVSKIEVTVRSRVAGSFDMNVSKPEYRIHSCFPYLHESVSQATQNTGSEMVCPVPVVLWLHLTYLLTGSVLYFPFFVYYITSRNPHHAIGEKSNRKQNGNQLEQSSECIFSHLIISIL